MISLSTTIFSIPLIKREDIDNFNCQETENQDCCALLAFKIAKNHHARVASIFIINKSGFNIKPLSNNLNKGRWIKHDDHQNIDINCDPPTEPIANGQFVSFSSITSHFFGGVEGVAYFIIDDNITNTKFSISWDVPLIGPPDYELDGLPTKKYYNESRNDLDKTVYQVTIN
ncbi:19774_t:CDS:2 [Funneliformis geosporum]|uniref:19774_t:CDS:1 n=1 Tax=Funneliformis geosporum TaxID=1117311 RepID=A0A9W4SF65_9GLOM|nr:19774_t:CDS:2 [Funneliformis geosporum]